MTILHNDEPYGLTLFKQTERGNYVSEGSGGITFAARQDKGWVAGRSRDKTKYSVPSDAKYYPTHIEALRSVSNPYGFMIDPFDGGERQLHPTRESL